VPTDGDDAGRERAEEGARPLAAERLEVPPPACGGEPSNQPDGDAAGRERADEEPSNQPGGDPKRAKIGAWPLIC
jgi:hypothetical protein